MVVIVVIVVVVMMMIMIMILAMIVVVVVVMWQNHYIVEIQNWQRTKLNVHCFAIAGFCSKICLIFLLLLLF